VCYYYRIRGAERQADLARRIGLPLAFLGEVCEKI